MAAATLVHVLLFDAGSDQEGIHSLELAGRTVVLLFETHDDAACYAGLLEAQDFPAPSVEALDREEMERFCAEAGYEARFVPRGFRPSSEEERLLLAPPEQNMDVSGWREQEQDEALRPPAQALAPDLKLDPALDDLRRRLEGLL